MLLGYHPAYTCIKVKGGWGMPDHCHQGTWKAIGYIGRGGLLVYWGMGGEDFGYTSRKEEVPFSGLRKVFGPHWAARVELQKIGSYGGSVTSCKFL